MSKKLAIRGDSTRGKEVIALLEMMGGKNIHNLDGSANMYSYYLFDYAILKDRLSITENDNFEIFTLQGFLEKFPFKIHDLVNIPEYESTVGICGMRWDPYSKYVEYMVYRNDNEEWYTARELLKYNNKPYHIQPRHMYLFNPHDIVVVESDNKKQKWICEYKSYINNQLHFYKGTYDTCSNEEENKSKLIYDSFYNVTPSDIIRIASSRERTLLKGMVENNNTTNPMQNILLELLNHIKNTSKEDLEKEFKEIEEWSNVGLTVEEFMNFCNKVNKKPKYPKLTNLTECKEILGEKDMYQGISGYKGELLSNFQRLFIFRDVYWKIAGEEMGLGKPWEPKYEALVDNTFFTIQTFNGEVDKSATSHRNAVLAFPTKEIRDAFYENFKYLIESCKELL